MSPVSFFKAPTTRPPTKAQTVKWEARAPGWTITCQKCGTMEPYGKYGAIQKISKKIRRQFTRCPHCRKFSFAHIEHRSAL